MKEKLQEYALVAEIISAIAIVLSLIFVGLQVRMGAEETAANSLALRSQVLQSMNDTDKDLLLFAATEMSQFDQVGYFFYGNALFRSRELYWVQHGAGLLDDAAYMTPFIRATLGTPAFAQAWIVQANEGGLQPGFVAEVNRLREVMELPAIEYTTDTP